MKIKVLSIIFIFMSVTLFAETANLTQITMNFVKSNQPITYNHIKARAVEKWGTDQEMILYEIGEQCQSYMNVIMIVGKNDFLKNETDQKILAKALLDWTHMTPEAAFNMITSGNFLRMDEDWTMVEYELKQQLEAKTKLGDN